MSEDTIYIIVIYTLLLTYKQHSIVDWFKDRERERDLFYSFKWN